MGLGLDKICSVSTSLCIPLLWLDFGSTLCVSLGLAAAADVRETSVPETRETSLASQEPALQPRAWRLTLLLIVTTASALPGSIMPEARGKHPDQGQPGTTKG